VRQRRSAEAQIRKRERLSRNRSATEPKRTQSVAFLNPWLIYAVIGGIVLFLYSLGWSELYAPLEPGLLIFFTGTIVVSIVMGIRLQPRLRALPPEGPAVEAHRAPKGVTMVIVAGFLGQFAYLGHAPLTDNLILHTGYEYGDFPGIPGLTVLLVTFSIFYSTLLAYQASRAVGRRRWSLAVQFVAIQSMFLLLLSRQAILLCLVMAAFLFLSRTRLTGRRVVVAVLAAVVVMYAFGCLGNLRSGFGPNDSSYITQFSRVSASYPTAMPGQFLWSYMYIVSPLGNLNDLVGNLPPTYSYSDMVVNMFPDFLTKRLFSDFDPTTPITVPYFNVSTGYAAAWKFNGYLALWATFGVVMVIASGAPRLVRPSWERATWAVACGIVAFMFYNNALSYSGVSLALAFPVLGSLVKVSATGRRQRTPRGSAGAPRSVDVSASQRAEPPG
jgi:hypothetical protein